MSTTACIFPRGYGVSTNCCNCRMVISQRHSLVCKIKQNILLEKTNESLKLLGHMK